MIPARLGSTRFPGKVLASDTGRPMIVHVCEAAARAPGVARVVVATDDGRVERAVVDAGFEAVRTRADHPNGTSRLAEAADLLELAPDQVVVNVQGDEPEAEPGPIAMAIRALTGGDTPADMATLASPFAPDEDPDDPNLVKVVLSRNSRAIYFSRSRIPFPRALGAPPLKHAGVYVYTAGFLRTYAALPPTPLEQTEGLEQLRALEHGRSIAVAVAAFRSHGIDTPEQYRAFVERWRAGDPPA